MNRHHLLILVLLVGSVAPLQAAPTPGLLQEATEGRGEPPPALHLSSFSSMRAGRLDGDGRVDTGAAVLSIGDGQRDVEVTELHYGRGPTLIGEFEGRLQGVLVEAVAAGTGVSGGGDERAMVSLQLKLTNDGGQRVELPLVLTMHAGGGDPALRPAPSVELEPETRFGLEDGMVTRDGHAVLRWLGGDPEVEIFERVGGPWEPAARLSYRFDMPAESIRYVEVELAGPPTNEAGDEAAWRTSFLRRRFVDLEETLRWQWQMRGRFANFISPIPVYGRTVAASMHMLRSFGIAHRQTRLLSDRAYGHPPTDAAVEAEIYGAFMQVNLDEITAETIDRLTDDLDRVLGTLSPERRVAYLHGLVQGLRLGPVGEHHPAVAQAILDHVESVPVRPWLDPDVVRGDLVAFVVEAGLEGADELPPLQWAAETDDGSQSNRVLAVRKALSAGDVAAAWDDLEPFLRTGYRGMGGWEASRELDGRFALAVLNIVREMIVDDHGDELVLFPRLPAEFIERGDELHIDYTPTRFGQIRAQLYAVGRKNVGLWVRSIRGHREAPVFARLPDTYTPRRLLGKPTGGEAQILEDGSIRMWIDEVGAGGLRLSTGVGAIGD